MGEMTFDNMQTFFNHIHSRGGANPANHGALGNFYAHMAVYSNPNTCSCKKGKNAYNNIFNICRSLTTSLTGQELANARSLFDNRGVVVNENGREVTRF